MTLTEAFAALEGSNVQSLVISPSGRSFLVLQHGMLSLQNPAELEHLLTTGKRPGQHPEQPSQEQQTNPS